MPIADVRKESDSHIRNPHVCRQPGLSSSVRVSGKLTEFFLRELQRARPRSTGRGQRGDQGRAAHPDQVRGSRHRALIDVRGQPGLDRVPDGCGAGVRTAAGRAGTFRGRCNDARGSTRPRRREGRVERAPDRGCAASAGASRGNHALGRDRVQEALTAVPAPRPCAASQHCT
jgi:hypothetical protein